MSVQAAVLSQYGGPEVLKVQDVPIPSIKEDDVLVKVEACALNKIDVWFRTGRYKISLPRILGGDIAGRVEKVGNCVKGIKEGDNVVIYNVLSDGTCYYCASGKRNRCVNVGFIGGAADGGYAEYISVKSYNVVPFKNMEYEHAACLPVDFGTSWNAISSIGFLKPSDTVFIMGAAGGLGHAFVKVSKMFGAVVIAASSSEDKIAFLRRIGADYTINYKKEDVRKAVLDLTNGIGVSVSVDHSGGDTWGICLDVLRKGGTMITAGITTGDQASVNIANIYRREIRIQGVYAYTREDLVKVIELASTGRLEPEIFKKFKLSEVVDAHRLFDSGSLMGKIILKPSE
jgi:NADPH:quinone reductase-like Zn-dependent oxidoreductase